MSDATSVFLELSLDLSDGIGATLQEADWSPEQMPMDAKESTFIMSPGSMSFIAVSMPWMAVGISPYAG